MSSIHTATRSSPNSAVTDLAARVGMTKQALGEFVATLEQAGLVEVAVDRRDRRVRLVRPTAAGRRLQRVVESAFAEIERDWRERVGAERWITFRRVLARSAATRTTPRHRPARTASCAWACRGR
jgi:DNA-binding MarR family transcriptional regulator